MCVFLLFGTKENFFRLQNSSQGEGGLSGSAIWNQRTYWDEKLHSTSFQPRPLSSIAVQVIIFQAKSLFCKAFQMNQSRICEMESLIYNSYLHNAGRKLFFSLLLLDWHFYNVPCKMRVVCGTVERCGHRFTWKQRNLHDCGEPHADTLLTFYAPCQYQNITSAVSVYRLSM